MAQKDHDITWAIVLQHMQGMEQRLLEIIEKRFAQVNDRFDRLESTVDHNHMMLSTQISNIDGRLDDVEVVQVPRLKKAMGMK